MPLRPLALATTAAAATLAAPSAVLAGTAPVPNAKSKLIVVGTSIGGLKLGASFATMTSTWGRATSCTSDHASCSYFAKTGGPTATVLFTNGVVTTLQLAVASKGGGAGALTVYRDAIGAHIGLPSAQLGQAYPSGSWHGSKAFVVPGPGKGETVFASVKGKITKLIVRIAPANLS